MSAFALNKLPPLAILLLMVFSPAFLAPNLLQSGKDWTVPRKILFVGNSYTYNNRLPELVARMAAAKGISMEVDQATAGGATLEDHWKGRQGLSTLAKIQKGGYDVVILQEQSLRPIQEPARMARYGGYLCNTIIEAGGIPLMYLTWAREQQPGTQQHLTEAYEKVAAENSGLVAPVGLAWQEARERQPGIRLYSGDGSHPSALGTYLAACVFMNVLTGDAPTDVPAGFGGRAQNGNSRREAQITEEQAEFCRQVAADTVARFVQPGW